MILQIDHLKSGYGKKIILEDINLTFENGKSTYIIGPNGCGKTTLLKCIASLQSFQGDIKIDKKNIQGFTRRLYAQKVGIISQMNAMPAQFSVFEAVLMGRYPYRKGFLQSYQNEDEQIALAALAQVGLLDEKDKKLETLSGGQLQRVYVARLFAQNPEIILLDEPTNHLDLKYQIELLEYITDWVKKENKMLIGVLHDLNLVHYYSDYVILMKEGKILESGKSEDVFTQSTLLNCYDMDVKKWMLAVSKKWEEQ